MFKRGFFRRGRIISDEGFSVGVLDRGRLAYREHRREMTIAGELLTRGFVVYLSSIGPWENGDDLSEDKKHQIADRVKRALEWAGMRVDLVQSPGLNPPP